MCTVHTAPERLAALVQVPQETVERALQVSYDTPESLLDRMVRLIADEGMDEAAAIEQVASRFRVSTPPEAPWSPWPKRPSAAERREQRVQQQRADRANQLLWPLESFTEALETLVLPLEVLQTDDPDYQRDADDPTLEELMDAVASDPRERLATMTAFLARARAILAAIEQAVAAYQQQHGAA